jgi:acyl transferase domain-containing protein
VKGGHFLAEDPAYFDAMFFSTTKTEVMSMDPQQRVILESVYHALENGEFFQINLSGHMDLTGSELQYR